MDQAGQESQLAARRRSRLVHQAIAYVEEGREYRVTVTELCQALDVGRRTLEYAFRDELGTSPKAYFIQQALEAVHRALERTNPGDRTVTEVATDFGFWHLGRFSTTYRATYGESPSATLMKSA